MIETDWKEVEVNGTIVVPFKAMDDTPGGRNLGRAEFSLCTRFFRGKLREFWVYPLQQRDVDTYWHHGWPNDHLTFSAYEGLNECRPWMLGWCEEHKAPFLRIYAPNGAKFLRIDRNGVSFQKTEW